MPSLRINLDLAIPESATGTKILQTTDPVSGLKSGGIMLPTAVVTKLQTLKTMIADFKQYAAKINAGQANEEASMTAEYFICHHDSNGVIPDEPRITI